MNGGWAADAFMTAMKTEVAMTIFWFTYTVSLVMFAAMPFVLAAFAIFSGLCRLRQERLCSPDKKEIQ